MNNLIPFNYNSKQVRTIVKDGEPRFVAKDVCDILELGDTSKAVSRLPEAMRGTNTIPTPGGNQEMLTVTEAGLYKLVFTSRKPEAEKFTDWVATEVIPSIRKTGQYISKPVTALEALAQTVQVLQEQDARLKQLESTTQAIKDTIIQEPDNWREDINHKLNKIAQALGSQKYQEIRTESYRLLEQRAHVDLERRLNNYRGNLINAGASQTAIKKANKLDIIEQDPKLREIYSKIVSEYLIKYVA